MEIKNIINHLKKTQEKINNLEEEYKDKPKGSIYSKRSYIYDHALKSYKEKLRRVWSPFELCHVKIETNCGKTLGVSLPSYLDVEDVKIVLKATSDYEMRDMVITNSTKIGEITKLD